MPALGDIIFKLMGQQDPRQQLIEQAMQGAGQGGTVPGAPAPAASTPAAAGTAPGTAAPAQPQAYTSPPQLFDLYQKVLDRQERNSNIDRGIGLIGASLAHDENRAGILKAFNGGDVGQGGGDPANLLDGVMKFQQANAALAQKAQMRASLPDIAQKYGLDLSTAQYLFETGKLDSVIGDLIKPNHQLATDPVTGQQHVVDLNNGTFVGEPLGEPKKREVELVDDGKGTGGKIAVYKDTKEPVGKNNIEGGPRKTEYIENPTTGGKELVYSDTKEPVPEGNNLPGAGNTSDQKDWNAAMRGKTPDDPGYMDFATWEKNKTAHAGVRFLPVGGGRVFDTETQKYITDPGDAAATSTDPNDAPVLAPGEVDTEFFSKLPPARQGLVKGVAEYTLDPSKISSIRGNERQKLIEEVKRYDPSFDMTQYASRAKMRQAVTSGDIGKNITSLNTVIGHLGTLAEKGKALDNYDYPILNMGKNFIEGQTGAPEPNNFDQAKEAVASELAKSFRGVGSMSKQEIDDWKATISAAQSPEQMRGAIKGAVELLKSRMDAVKEQYTKTMNKPWDIPFLSPKAKEVLKDLDVDPAEIDPLAANDNSPDAPATDAKADDLSIDDLVKKYDRK